MKVFLDFEASSLGRDSYPIEVGWVFEDGAAEGRLIRPAPGWTDWDPAAEAVHGLSRTRLEAEGDDHGDVAARMMETLAGHDLLASAPSWDGKWLSVLLRAAGLPRHALRLRDTEEAFGEAVRQRLPPQAGPEAVGNAVQLARLRMAGEPVAHRAVEERPARMAALAVATDRRPGHRGAGGLNARPSLATGVRSAGQAAKG